MWSQENILNSNCWLKDVPDGMIRKPRYILCLLRVSPASPLIINIPILFQLPSRYFLYFPTVLGGNGAWRRRRNIGWDWWWYRTRPRAAGAGWRWRFVIPHDLRCLSSRSREYNPEYYSVADLKWFKANAAVDLFDIWRSEDAEMNEPMSDLNLSLILEQASSRTKRAEIHVSSDMMVSW